jgi:low affinity Fe/Cu permease
MDEFFRRIARRTTNVVGSPATFISCVALTLLWVIGGFFIGFGSTYQLYYNTFVNAVTWLLVILLQNSQNSYTQALQLKLDELLRAKKDARDELVDLESLPEEDLNRLQDEFSRLREKKQKEQRP